MNHTSTEANLTASLHEKAEILKLSSQGFVIKLKWLNVESGLLSDWILDLRTEGWCSQFSTSTILW
jgi:hypothetical protein